MIKIIEQDIIFLSYDEPNAEKIYESALSPDQRLMWEKRIARAWTLIPVAVLASLGVPDQGMQG